MANRVIRSNPYSAGRFEPGAIPWYGEDIAALFARATQLGARHQILGAHGSGKSTLLRHLELHAERVARTRVFRFRGSAKPALGALLSLALSRTPVLVLVDEHAELGFLRRRLLRLAGRSVALVFATHEDLGLPTLARCEVDDRVARHVIDHLLGDSAVARPGGLAARIARHHGNLREVLFELYDEAEAPRP